jgi:hypothetical protein
MQSSLSEGIPAHLDQQLVNFDYLGGTQRRWHEKLLFFINA